LPFVLQEKRNRIVFSDEISYNKGEANLLVQLEEALQSTSKLDEEIKELSISLEIDDLRKKAEELEKITCEPGFWDNAENTQTVLTSLKNTNQTIEDYQKLFDGAESLRALIELAIEENDESFTDEILDELKKLQKESDSQRIRALLSGEYDRNNAILSIHPGAGGTEAQDWAEMLYRMYSRWAERHGFKVKVLDYLDGEEAGIKSVTILVEGNYAYGYLKSENGVHRLVRVSPFDSSGRRHTSFTSVEILPELDDNTDIEIKDEDLEITAHRSSGAGGQHVNKTDSAIRIVHKPTGIVVGCQTERSQLQNKETALKMLKAKLVEIKERENLDKIEDIKGEKANIEWGSQIRSYVFMPYTLVKDNRTGYEDGNISAVMDGDLDEFMNAYLRAKGNFKK